MPHDEDVAILRPRKGRTEVFVNSALALERFGFVEIRVEVQRRTTRNGTNCVPVVGGAQAEPFRLCDVHDVPNYART